MPNSRSVTAVMQNRRSVRAFTAQGVDAAVLRTALAAAQRAPSGGNLQPWQAVVVTGQPWDALKSAVAARIALGPAGFEPEYDIYPKDLGEPWRARRYQVGEALYTALGIPRDDKAGRQMQFAENFRGFGAPVMLFLHCHRTMGPPQWADMGMWLQSLMLLLGEAGLGSCPQECWAVYGQTVREQLAIPDNHLLFCGLAIGHTDGSHPVNQWPVARAGVDEAVDLRGFD